MDPESADWLAKVDARLRALYDREKDNAVAARETAHVLLRLKDPVDPSRLRVPGLALGSVAGDVVTGSLRLCDLPLVATAHEVVYVELSAPFGLDAAPQVGPTSADDDVDD